jgi:hypothetical protein
LSTVIRRLACGTVTAVALALLTTGCVSSTGSGNTAASQPTASPPAGTKPLPTPSPTKTGPGPMTAAELSWLSAIETMHYKVDTIYQKDRVLTRREALSLGNALAQCGRTLRRIGPGTARLKPVYTLVKEACALFDKGAKCWVTAAGAMDAGGGVAAGTPEERIFDKAMSCGDASYGDGTNLLSDAERKGGLIKSEAD